ncbi:unnamed protein product [Rotaria sp. Silwood2]|nr:unnamed protein product [Rotaria sp. Silwood2]
MVLSDVSVQPCILYGNSGTGKSSIMAEIAIKIEKWFAKPSSVSVVIRFLGTTPQSSDVRRPLISIIQQICIIYNIKLSYLIHDSMTIQNLKRILEHILGQIPENEQLILLFDSIDQLQVEYYDCSKWLPMNYPKNIKCIISTIPVIEDKNIDYKILEGLKSLFGDTSMIEVTEFDEHVAQQVFHSWLERDQRCLTPLQMEWLQPKFLPNSDYGEPQPTPLFLSLLYEITRSWHSFDDEPDPSFLQKKSTRGAIKYLYSKRSQKHGEILFERAMAYLRQAGGLSETELEDMLSADSEVLQSIFIHYLPPLSIFRLPSTLWIRIRNDMQKYLVEKTVDNVSVIYFYHRSFLERGSFGGNEAKEVELIRRAYYAGTIGHFQNLHDQPFEIKSLKLIEKNHGNTSLCVDRRLAKQSPYMTNVKGKGPIYNMRRINQLCMNLDNICCEPWFLYDYDFISSYLHCYKINELRASEWFYPELRFLLTQYEACSFVLDTYPKNFAFELSSRLLPLIEILPELIYKLFQQCLNHCNLLMLEDEARSFQACMSRYTVGIVYAIGLDLDSSNLFVLLSEKLLSFHLSEYYLAGKVNEYQLPPNIFTSIKYSNFYVCLYSSQSLLVLKCAQTQQCMLQLTIDELLYIDFIHIGTLLTCSGSSKSIDIWNCSKKVMMGQHAYNESILQCCTLKIDDGVLIKVILKTGLIQYLRININEHDENNRICFIPIATLQEKPRNESILFNHETDVFYSEGQSCIYLYHFERFANDCFEKLENLPPLNRIVYRHHCISEETTYNAALIWLTEESLVIFHSCGDHFIISDDESGITVYCTLENGELPSTISNQLRIEYCGGRPCPVCYKCSDWYFTGLDHKDCNYDWHAYADHLGSLVDPYYKWHHRDGATCGYRSYPHFVHYIAYHGECSLVRKCPPLTSNHDDGYPPSARNGPNICHCPPKEWLWQLNILKTCIG